jgi:hypothetical protein
MLFSQPQIPDQFEVAGVAVEHLAGDHLRHP